MRENHTVLILDDDTAAVSSVKRLLTTRGFHVRTHSKAEELFASGLPPVPSVLLLEHTLGNGDSGEQVHQQILYQKWFLPTIFLSASWNVGLVVRVMQAGADSCLVKPCDPSQLLNEVSKSLLRAKNNWELEKRKEDIRTNVASLNPREWEIIRLVAKGMLNKEIAEQLNLATITVKVNRARAMCKLGAGNPAHMIQLLHVGGISLSEL